MNPDPELYNLNPTDPTLQPVYHDGEPWNAEPETLPANPRPPTPKL